ncbi:hypothetical protein OEZ85_006379 [Tetradesmus obliquus]|uniref:BTB domain-containing protein n=1 Tax=Tetradesmus obliquus TaxID=3088 RepID=A0ABY8TUD3_TETOB|nr:hypothetical protein OEZ85_006379 [Tetradesmus obliquus]
MAGLEGFYGRENLADLDVVIVQANTMACDKSSRRKRSRAEELVLPGHRLAVCAASEVLSAQILNWSAAAPSKQRQRINIEVPAGQLEVGRLLLGCMYQQQPDLRSTEQQATLLQLLVLADKYAVPGAVAAVNRAFKETPASLVRMPRCSHLYITTVLLQHPEDVVEAVGLGHLLNAAACSAAGSQLVEEIDSSPTRREYPGWFLPARPASSMQQLVNDWHVKLQDVKVMFERRVAENRIEAYFGQNRNWGVTTFVFNGGTTAWQEAKQQLRAAHAVHADGCLHIQVIVTGMA